MKITIKDIAKDLNVSKTTVSFVLSGNGPSMGISAKTQERILQYAEEKGYQPNLLAKSLYSGKSYTLGVVVPSIADMFYAELVRECEIEAKKQGYILTICSTERDVELEARMIRMLKTKQVDGLILAPTEYCKKELELLLKEDFEKINLKISEGELHERFRLIGPVHWWKIALLVILAFTMFLWIAAPWIKKWSGGTITYLSIASSVCVTLSILVMGKLTGIVNW